MIYSHDFWIINQEKETNKQKEKQQPDNIGDILYGVS